MRKVLSKYSLFKYLDPLGNVRILQTPMWSLEVFLGGPVFRRPFFLWRPSVLAQERKKERSAAMRTWREQDPKPQKECWVATP